MLQMQLSLHERWLLPWLSILFSLPLQSLHFSGSLNRVHGSLFASLAAFIDLSACFPARHHWFHLLGRNRRDFHHTGRCFYRPISSSLYCFSASGLALMLLVASVLPFFAIVCPAWTDVPPLAFSSPTGLSRLLSAFVSAPLTSHRFHRQLLTATIGCRSTFLSYSLFHSGCGFRHILPGILPVFFRSYLP